VDLVDLVDAMDAHDGSGSPRRMPDPFRL